MRISLQAYLHGVESVRRGGAKKPAFEAEFSMGKRLLLSVLVALTVCGGLPGRGPDQPTREDTKAAGAPAGLLAALKDKDPSVRLQAAQLLVQMGEAKAALPAVEEL